MDEYKKFGVSDILMLLAIGLWAVNFSFVKVALRELSPMGFNGIRLAFASLLLVSFLAISRENFSVTKGDMWKLMFVGIVGNTVYQLLFIHGIYATTASNTAIIIAITPVFIALLSSILKHERLNWAAWAGILFSFIGFYLVVAKQSGSLSFVGEGIKGDLMIFVGTLCWAVYTVFSKPLLQKYSALKLTTITMVFGTVFFLPFSLADMIRLPYGQISLEAWGSLGFSGLFALAVCYVIWYTSVRRVGNSRTAIYDNLVPIATVIFAYFIIDERITFLQAMGTVIILGGVYLTRSGYRFFEKKRVIDSKRKNS
ncbi:MAG: DMT family transporter [Candidatus Aminicenantes bacterium]|jgi:drug/metabolite transporter (DMT)-like permease